MQTNYGHLELKIVMDHADSGSPFVVLVTCPATEAGKTLARLLLEKRLAACVNILPQVTSLYHWEGKICEDGEVLLVIKTRQELYPELEKTVKANHPYSVPECIALPIVAGSRDYLQWLLAETGRSPSTL